jgi:flagellar basal-body rod protein FlgG
MSVQSLYTAATGMDSQQTKLDVIANNLANINTTGFKKGRANFEDNFYRHYMLPNQNTAEGISIGLGSKVSSIQTEQKQGSFQDTGNALDVAIEGRGFFIATDPITNETVYTRAGNFSVNAQGQLVLGSAQLGRLVEPNITIPPEATSVSIATDGNVYYYTQGQTAASNAGQLNIATFVNPEGLIKKGENLYAQSDASGQPQQNTPGVSGTGMLRSTFLETSNVNPVSELIDLITTQRSFELNAQMIQAGDQILQLISNLRR